MAKSPSVARALENYYRGDPMPTPPTTMHLGLVDAVDGELAYPGYDRVVVDANATTFGVDGAPLLTQFAIPFPGPTSGGPHTQAVKGRFYKADTGTDYWFDDVLTTPKTPITGQDFVVPLGGIGHTENPAP